MSNSGVRRLEDLRREASDAARGLQGGEQALDARELRILLSVSAAVAAASSLTELVGIAADQALAALGATSISVSRWESEAEILRTLVNAGRLAPGEIPPSGGGDLPPFGRRPAPSRPPLQGRSDVGPVDDPALHPLERSLLERQSPALAPASRCR